MARRSARGVASATLLLVATALRASEPFPVHPELVGLKKVAIVLTFAIDMKRESVENDIRSRLAEAGIEVDESGAAATLRIDVDTSVFETPLCPGMTSLQVRLALEEPVILERNRKLKAIRAQTWTDEHVASIVSKADVATLAADDVRFLVDRFIYNVKFSTSEYAKWKKP